MDFKKYRNKLDPNLRLEKLLDNDEKVLWQGKPVKKAFILNKIIGMLPVAILWLAFDGLFIAFMAIGWKQLPTIVQIILPIFFVVHLAPVWIWLVNTIFAIRQWNLTEYMITNRRVLIKSGLFAAGFKSYYYNEIQSTTVHIGFIDRLCHVGDIIILDRQAPSNSKGTVNGIIDIENPYEVYKLLEKTTRDIATDISYPNAYRPSNNPGYKTDLDDKSSTLIK